LIINTIPAIANATVLIDNKPYYSNSHGNIVFSAEAGKHTIAIPDRIAIENHNQTDKTFYTFGKWRPFMPQNFTISLKEGIVTHLELGIIKMSNVQFQFIDYKSNPIEKSMVEKAVLISNKGNLIELRYPFQTFLNNNDFNASQPMEVERRPENLTILSPQGMIIDNVDYRIVEVLINGVNVIDRRNQQPFSASNTTSVEVPCRVYPLQIRVTDSIFENPIAARIDLINMDAITISSPSSSSSSSSITIQNNIGTNFSSIKKSENAFGDENSDESILIPKLPRGIYLIKIGREEGMAGSNVVVLTKPQDIEIKMLSYRSAVILLIVALTILALLIFIGKKLATRFSVDRRGRVVNRSSNLN
jgi:hypothetical protein